MDGALEQVISPEGRMSREEAAVHIVLGEARRDSLLGAIVSDIDETPAAYGAFAMLLGARLVEDGRRVLIKVNASEHERAWLPAMEGIDRGVVPAVHGAGDHVGGLPLGWLALEWLPHQPPGFGGPGWYDPLMRATMRWHLAASQVDLSPAHVIDHDCAASWIDDLLVWEPTPELRRLRDRFSDDWAWVSSLCQPVASHGDVHFFNAGSRSADPLDALVLFDPIPRVAPWPYDAANCHTLTNYHLQGADQSLVEIFAELRRGQGLPTPDPLEVQRISALFCAWLATMWRSVFPDGHGPVTAAYVERGLAV